MLIYAHIDTLAWAASEKTRMSVRGNFDASVSLWLLPQLAPNAPEVSATDLYGARCAVLYTPTGKSDLAADGKAREIAYA